MNYVTMLKILKEEFVKHLALGKADVFGCFEQGSCYYSTHFEGNQTMQREFPDNSALFGLVLS